MSYWINGRVAAPPATVTKTPRHALITDHSALHTPHHSHLCYGHHSVNSGVLTYLPLNQPVILALVFIAGSTSCQ